VELLIFAAGMTFGLLIGAALAAAIAFIWQRQGHERAFGTISEQLRSAAEQNQQVLEATTALNSALAHPILRGDWGDRMVEDVLRPIGFVEGINYLKQETMDCGSGRPDYTFLLPRRLKVNLDAKFPLTNYRSHHNAKTDIEKDEFKKRFLRDVRDRVKEVMAREYVNPSVGTVDFVLIFVPNEPVYSFINLHDPELFDFALKKNVVLCSPWTLYPILSVIRRAVDNFIVERNATELLPLLAKFEKHWNEYKECLEKMGRKIQDTQEEYGQLVGTRERQLDRVLREIDQLRKRTDFHSVEPRLQGNTGEASPAVPQVESDAELPRPG
jgi:DNA recombination protein RmuC